ncbi:hypothetical protein, partial [Collinsella sp. LCP19S3_B11]
MSFINQVFSWARKIIPASIVPDVPVGTFIHTSAGNGGTDQPTQRFGIGGTDLGFLFEGGKSVNGGKALWVGG